MSHTTEQIDKLFLELSQFTRARTARELYLEQRNAELDALSSAISRDCNAVALERNDYREKLHLANTRIAELVEALNKYGEHRPSCTFYPSDPDMIDPLSNQCTCGLEQALAAQKEAT